MGEKDVVLAASYSIIESLGIMHLAEIAKQEGWKPTIVLGTEPDFSEIEEVLEKVKPKFLGMTTYTGNHVYAFKMFDRLRSKGMGDMKIIVGGPHPTAFPEHAIKHADFVVPSEGFHSFRQILKGEVNPGVIPVTELEEFPIPDRESFYKASPSHGINPIKNIITQTGCPFRCTYCYNAQNVSSIESSLTPEGAEKMKAVLKGSAGRLFPKNVRSVDSVLKEVEDIQRLDPKTKMIFFQDDIFGVDINWLKEFRQKYNARIPFHIMTRFEFFDPNTHGKERAKLMVESGCTGLTFAVESGDVNMRREVLDRKMEADMMYRSLRVAAEFGLTVRTFSMVGLPYGATEKPTKMGLEADLETLELNVKLKEMTGLPTIAWASILVPYPKTAIDPYCVKYGFYTGDFNDIIEGSYRQDSVLNFAKKWYGPGLTKDTPGIWMNKEEQEAYKQKLSQLMYYFPTFAAQPKGHILARKFLETGDLTPHGFNNAFRSHAYDFELFKVANDIGDIGVKSAETHLGRYNPMIHGNKEAPLPVIPNENSLPVVAENVIN